MWLKQQIDKRSHEGKEFMFSFSVCMGPFKCLCVLRNSQTTISLPKASPDPQTQKNNTTHWSTMDQLQQLMCNHVSVVKSCSCAVNGKCCTFMQRVRNPQKEAAGKEEEKRKKRREKDTERGFISPSRCRVLLGHPVSSQDSLQAAKWIDCPWIPVPAWLPTLS